MERACGSWLTAACECPPACRRYPVRTAARRCRSPAAARQSGGRRAARLKRPTICHESSRIERKKRAQNCSDSGGSWVYYPGSAPRRAATDLRWLSARGSAGCTMGRGLAPARQTRPRPHAHGRTRRHLNRPAICSESARIERAEQNVKDEIAAPRSLLPWIVLVSAAIQLLNEPASAAASRIVRWAASPRTQSQVTPAHTGLTQGRYVDLGFRGSAHLPRAPTRSAASSGLLRPALPRQC